MNLWEQLIASFSKFIEFFYQVTIFFGIPSYGLAIILITIVIKMALYPLTVKQMRSIRVMSEIAPKHKALQEKYKKDPQKAQEAVVALYREHGVNPLGGCLPMLVQLPILIAFYRSLMSFTFTDVEHAGFLWVANIAYPDNQFPFILPIVAGVSTFIQMKVSTPPSSGNSQSEQTQKMMAIIMPIMIAWMAYSFAAGLALYWVVFNVVGTLQQLYINRKTEREKGVRAA
ncbi:MAG: YidC/Oxa1 family membrane protein insertase [Heliobacteriaceae bacterium]|nr:YidC/Oxa1 family membrane protein insertase [Heliobacteriaceae bacterium]MDD4587684.1 YidC/Oxa1 family membrane protein insertase [Heliobacteriaceae bacterium]